MDYTEENISKVPTIILHEQIKKCKSFLNVCERDNRKEQYKYLVKKYRLMQVESTKRNGGK